MSNKVCKITSIDLGPSEIEPTIVTFQNGQLQPTKNTNQLQCAKFYNQKHKKTFTTVATKRLVYAGEQDTDDDVNTFIAIRNKKTNTVRLVQVNSANLHPQVKLESMLETTLNNSTLNVRSLYKEFGSKKTKRQTEQMEKMKMDATLVEEELKDAVANVELTEEDLTLPSGEDAICEHNPTINRNAQDVADVYDVTALLTQNELNSLKELALEVRDNSTISEELCPFAMYCVNALKQAEIEDLDKYEIALYIDATLKFFKIPIKNMRKGIGPYPKLICDKVLREFSVVSENNRYRPITMRDKAVCYVIVLALIILNYRIDATSLSASINMGLKKINDVARTLGAHTLKSKDKDKEANYIILKLPLASPVKGKFVKKRKL